jgi:hypothetical protein
MTVSTVTVLLYHAAATLKVQKLSVQSDCVLATSYVMDDEMILVGQL